MTQVGRRDADVVEGRDVDQVSFGNVGGMVKLVAFLKRTEG